ncbi:MAG: hypothetical protein QM706_17520 [Nitrospira sp.]
MTLFELKRIGAVLAAPSSLLGLGRLRRQSLVAAEALTVFPGRMRQRWRPNGRRRNSRRLDYDVIRTQANQCGLGRSIKPLGPWPASPAESGRSRGVDGLSRKDAAVMAAKRQTKELSPT